MVGTLQEAFDTIEAVFQKYGERHYQIFTGFKTVTDEELREARGQLQAASELIRSLRNHLGYTVEE